MPRAKAVCTESVIVACGSTKVGVVWAHGAGAGAWRCAACPARPPLPSGDTRNANWYGRFVKDQFACLKNKELHPCAPPLQPPAHVFAATGKRCGAGGTTGAAWQLLETKKCLAHASNAGQPVTSSLLHAPGQVHVHHSVHPRVQIRADAQRWTAGHAMLDAETSP